MRPINKRENVLPDLLALCEKLGRIPNLSEVREHRVAGCPKILADVCSDNGYDDYRDLCRKHGYGRSGDVFVDGKYKDAKTLTIEEYKTLWSEFRKKYGKFPTYCNMSVRIKNNYNLPHGTNFDKALKEHGMSKGEFERDLGSTKRIANINKYDEYVAIYIKKSNEQKSPLRYQDLFEWKNNTPSPQWLIKHCPDSNIKSFNGFVEWCGFKPYNTVSKEYAIRKILEKQDKVNRPLVVTDFEGGSEDVGISTISRIWGSFNLMKEDLNLEIAWESTNKDITIDKLIIDLKQVCKNVYKEEGSIVITTQDIKKYGEYSYDSYIKHLGQDGTTLQEVLSSLGFELAKQGSGVTHNFPDGETTLSRHETKMSKYLRNNLGLKFNKDYVRDVLYSDFIETYDGYMNCDYVVRWNNETIYIEIAGLLRDYKSWYYDNKELTSNSKERYRQSLGKKESMLKANSLKYYLLFPEDCNDGYLNRIFGV